MGPHVAGGWGAMGGGSGGAGYGGGSMGGGNQNVVINVKPPQANTIQINSGHHEAWMVVEENGITSKVKTKNDRWVQLDPNAIVEAHPLEIGIGCTPEQAELTAIREEYENHIKNSPWLQKLKVEYDAAQKRAELFSILQGTENAAI